MENRILEVLVRTLSFEIELPVEVVGISLEVSTAIALYALLILVVLELENEWIGEEEGFLEKAGVLSPPSASPYLKPSDRDFSGILPPPTQLAAYPLQLG